MGLPISQRLTMRVLAATLCLVSITRVAHAEFIPLGDLLPNPAVSSRAWSVADDGSVAGEGFSTFQESFYWTELDGMLGLGDISGGANASVAHGISDAGTIVVGEGNIGGTVRAYRWTEAGGIADLGKLAGGFNLSRAWGISGNGTVIVGESGSTAAGVGRTEGFRWTQADGMVGLGDLSGGVFQSKAFATNEDGSVIVGWGESASGVEAFRWTQSGGMVGLGDLVGGAFSSSATDVSEDGSVVVGVSFSASGRQAFRWTQSDGMVGLGELPGGTFDSLARGVSGDGSIVVGTSVGSNGAIGNAFIWDEINGMRDLKTVLINDHGVTNLTGWFLRDATGISTNGRYITGYGNNPTGNVEAWLVDLGPSLSVPEPTSFAMIALGFPAIVRAARRKKQVEREFALDG